MKNRRIDVDVMTSTAILDDIISTPNDYVSEPDYSQNHSVIDLEWIPVIQDGFEKLVTLRSVFSQGHLYSGFGHSLIPIEKESMLRFLSSIAAVIVRHPSIDSDDIPDMKTAERLFTAEAVDSFFADFADHLDLLHKHFPFMQEWDVPAGIPVASFDKDIRSMSVHVPGGSTTTWGVREETRDVSDPKFLARLLVVQWYHSRPNNGAPKSTHAGKPVAGAPSGFGKSDSTYYLIGATIAETLFANVLDEWVYSDDLPDWLAQDYVPESTELSANPRSLWRTNWTPNRPALHWDDNGRVDTYALGQTRQLVPFLPAPKGMNASEKESAKAMHNMDYAHLWKPEPIPKDAVEAVPTFKRAVASGKMQSVEGIRLWFNNNYDKLLEDWGNDRVLPKDKLDVQLIGIYNEDGGQQTPDFKVSEWYVIDFNRISTSNFEDREKLMLVLDTIAQIVAQLKTSLKKATPGLDSKKASPLIANTERSFYAEIDQDILPFIDSLAEADDQHIVKTLNVMVDTAKTVMRRATESMSSPGTVAYVEVARADFSKKAREVLNKATKGIIIEIKENQ